MSTALGSYSLFTMRSYLTLNILYMVIRSCHGKRKPQLACCSQHKNKRPGENVGMEVGFILKETTP